MSGVDENPENEQAIEDYAFLAGKAGYAYEQSRMEIAARTASMLRKIEGRARRSAGETEDVDEQSPAKIPHRAPLIDPTDKQHTFSELVRSMDACALGKLHKEKVDALMVVDPKRNARVPSRFCSFHLGGFNLDEKSTVSLGPLYEPHMSLRSKRLTEYVTADQHLRLASSSTDVISLRVVKVGPGCTYPVEVYGKVIARDEVDYKCVFLFDRERKDAQLIKSEKDMLALTGPYRPLITLDLMYFEFDLKTKGERDHEDVQFSQGVIPYYGNPDHKRIILQLPSFKSTVKLVLQRVSLPVAASIEVSVVNEGHDDTFVHYNGKITAGTTRNYRQHMVLYDSSVPSSGSLVTRNGSLVLYRNLVSVKGYAEDPDEELVLYVYFLDAGCEIEDEDKKRPEEEDEEEEEEEEKEEEEKEEEEEEEEKEVEKEDPKEEEPKNVVTLKYPLNETVWEYGSPKLKVKVDWTAILNTRKRNDYFHRNGIVPDGYRSPDYRWGGFLESD